MAQRYIFSFTGLWLFFSLASAQTFDDLFAASRTAFEQGRSAEYMKLAEQARRLEPSNPYAMVNLARAYAMNGQKTKCIELLDDIAVIGFDFDIEHDSGFQNIRHHSLLKDILAKGKQKAHVVNSEIVQTLPDTSFVSGGLGYNPRTKKFFIANSSSGTIRMLNPVDGSAEQISQFETNHPASIQSIRIDAARNLLWVCGTDSTGMPGLLRYDLDDEEGPKRFPCSAGGGDIAFLPSGDLVLADRGDNGIDKFSMTEEKFVRWFSDPRIVHPSGIAVSPDQHYLFVSTSSGIARISISDTSMVFLTAPPKVPLNGIDGIGFFQGNLIAIQNNAGPQARIMKFGLNEKMDGVKAAEVLESGNSLYETISAGTIAGDDLYFLGNLQKSTAPLLLLRISLAE
ncbi:MAG: hypothetical protein WCT99_04680 [Bacteroidota bacterium]|jgi:hypothetical protein